jgi:hypothetical protein
MGVQVETIGKFASGDVGFDCKIAYKIAPPKFFRGAKPSMQMQNRYGIAVELQIRDDFIAFDFEGEIKLFAEPEQIEINGFAVVFLFAGRTVASDNYQKKQASFERIQFTG